MAPALLTTLVFPLLFVSSTALQWNAALPTGRVLGDADINGWTPKPTPPPKSHWPDLAGVPSLQDLFKRQLGLHTCGYINAQSAGYLTCPDGYVCATGSIDNVAACCDPGRLSICYLPTSCIGYSDLASSCGSSCSQNPFITKCTNVSTPACYTWAYNYTTAFPTQVGCTNIPFSQIVELSYTDGANPFSGTIRPAAVVDSVTAVFSSSKSGSSTLTSSTSSSSASLSSSTSSSIVIEPSAPDLTTTATSSSSSSTSTGGGGGGGSNVGAIVGGVIGGLAVIGILVGVIVWMLIRNRRRNAATAAAAGGGAGGYTDASMKQAPQEYYGGGAGAGHNFSPQSAYSGLTATEPAPTASTAPVEADGVPVMTNYGGQQVHELPAHY